MSISRRIRIVKFLIPFCVFVGFGCVVMHDGFKRCMDVPLITESELKQYEEDLEIEVGKIRFNGEKAAVDISNDTIYISQSKSKISHYSVLQGTLDYLDPEYSLYFLKNENIENIPEIIRNGEPLSLFVEKNKKIKKMNVVLTTLPVIRMESKWEEAGERGRMVHHGNMILWAGEDPITNNYCTTSAHLIWRIRGITSAKTEKPPWKLTIQNASGDNRDLELLGLGADDDWILNSMVFDDTKIKEKLFMDTWNEIADISDYNYKMSMGEYVEVVTDGEYMGVYLLQRRLDKKYLELQDKDILLKVTTYQAQNAEEAYELVTEVENREKVYSHMQKIYEGSDCSSIDVSNFIDVNLMLQFMDARDNTGLKNMYMVLEEENNEYKISLLPWDTDQSLGLVWKEEAGGFCYDYRMAMDEFSCRMETEAVKKANPQYDENAKDRWNELKKSIFLVEKLTSKIDDLGENLDFCGALQRDREKWGERYAGEDSVENMKKFIAERWNVLEQYYCQ